MEEPRFRTEEFQAKGEEVLSTLKRILHEGNVRRILIKDETGRTLLDIPLTFGAVAALLLPQWAAIGAVAALAARLSIVVEKTAEATPPAPPEPPASTTPPQPPPPAV